MNLLPLARKQLIEKLWKRFRGQVEAAESLDEDCRDQGIPLSLDHFAIIDLPSAESGIPALQRIFECLQFEKRGQGYLKEKANDFIWMAEIDAVEKSADEALPQVVLADFRLAELSLPVREIIERVTRRIPAAPFRDIETLAQKAQDGDHRASDLLVTIVFNYLTQKSHELPTREEFQIVQRENELLAWVLIFGREINHFGIAAHQMTQFEGLRELNFYLENELGFELSLRKGKLIQGDKHQGIEQSATHSHEVITQLHGGPVTLRDRFIEMVWRHPILKSSTPVFPGMWSSIFRGFAAQNADQIIESLYRKPA